MPTWLLQAINALASFVLFAFGYKTAKQEDEIESLKAANEAFKRREKIQEKYTKKRSLIPDNWSELNRLRKQKKS